MALVARYHESMSRAIVSDRKATAVEVRTHTAAIRSIVDELGLVQPHLRDDGALVIHSSEPGYKTANRLSAALSEVVGAYVHVITDDVPGASPAKAL